MTKEKQTQTIIVTKPHCPSIPDEVLFNTLIFAFNEQAPGAVSSTAEVQNMHPAYALEVSIESGNILAFIAYLKNVAPDVKF